MIVRSVCALALSGWLMTGLAVAGPIFSGPASVSGVNNSLTFDLINAGDLGTLANLPSDPSEFEIQVISVVWSFDPPPGQNGLLSLGGTLELGGINSGLSFQETIDMSDETGNVIFSANSAGPGGLVFSEALAQHLLDNAGQILGKVIPKPGTEQAWDDYFATGASLTNYLFIELTFKDANQIPEPGAVLVWAGVGGLGILVHRWMKRIKSA